MSRFCAYVENSRRNCNKVHTLYSIVTSPRHMLYMKDLDNEIKNKSLNYIGKSVATAKLLVHKNLSKKFYKRLRNFKIIMSCFDFMTVYDISKTPI